ncbi:MAG: insulinase family protein, partial [candidate division Zixibacteria bacterium]|nr:insulinase family protein [candidate division Zixibacteria bacterium]
MKTICLVATVASLLSLGNALGQFDLDIETTVLPNSLTLLTYVDTTVPTVSYQTFINAGSRDETKPGASGIAHVFEHMMFRGTE